MEKLVLASNNQGKVKEFKKILSDYEILTLKELNVVCDPEETGTTFYENALIKAKTVSDLTGMTAIADDSGLCVDYLGGKPGIYSARYSGGNDKDNRDKLLRDLEGVKEKDRGAKFCSSVVMYKTDGEIIAGYGETLGSILFSEEGENGFGYDCIFYSEDLKKSFGKATDEEKNAVSHRFRAITDLKNKLK